MAKEEMSEVSGWALTLYKGQLAAYMARLPQDPAGTSTGYIHQEAKAETLWRTGKGKQGLLVKIVIK